MTISKEQLIDISVLGPVWGFNRQLSDRVGEIPNGNYAAELVRIHERAYGQLCEPHARLEIRLPGANAYADIPFAYLEQIDPEYGLEAA